MRAITFYIFEQLCVLLGVAYLNFLHVLWSHSYILIGETDVKSCLENIQENFIRIDVPPWIHVDVGLVLLKWNWTHTFQEMFI